LTILLTKINGWDLAPPILRNSEPAPQRFRCLTYHHILRTYCYFPFTTSHSLRSLTNYNEGKGWSETEKKKHEAPHDAHHFGWPFSTLCFP